MIKFTSNNDFDFQIESVNIITDDKQLTKRASAKELLRYDKTPNQTDLHIIALGAYEGTGFNRNGDMFKEADCKSNHHYFKVANRAVHRHHKNKPNDPKYGNIKAAAYNETMKRIELIVGLDNDKCADILDEQEKRGNTNWSMASKQAYDLCTWCGHKAKTDKDRCEHIPAKIGELNKAGEMCGMENPDPRWFEISYVHRPADRIGMSLGKVASDRMKPMLPRDYLAIYTGFQAPESEIYISKKASDKRDILHKLAEMEKHLDAVAKKGGKSSGKDLYLQRQASKLNKGKKIEGKEMDELRKHEPSKAFKGMADKGIVMGPDEFSNYAFGDKLKPEAVQGMKTHLPDIYSQLDQEGAGDVVNNEQFEPAPGNLLPPELQGLLGKLFQDHSLMGGPAHNRVIRITIEMGGAGGKPSGAPEAGELKPSPAPEEKSKHAADKELAKIYASYKLAALNYMQEKGILDEEVLWNAVIQNRG